VRALLIILFSFTLIEDFFFIFVSFFSFAPLPLTLSVSLFLPQLKKNMLAYHETDFITIIKSFNSTGFSQMFQIFSQLLPKKCYLEFWAFPHSRLYVPYKEMRSLWGWSTIPQQKKFGEGWLALQALHFIIQNI
jgi:hypothetical protein